MGLDFTSCIEGDFNGFDDGALFRLANGQVWQQTRFRYQYRYAYCPSVRIYESRGTHFLEVAGMDAAIEVTEVNVVCEGSIISDFTGLNSGMRFQFQNGQVWEQAEYKYHYCYAYRPNAFVVHGTNGYELHVDGMDENVRVRRVR